MTDPRKDRGRPVAEQAADWYLRLQEAPGRAERARFADWLRRSPVHVEEFLRVGGVRNTVANLPADCVPDVRELVAGARRNVVDLGSDGSREAGNVRRRRRLGPWSAAVAGGVAMVAVSLALVVLRDEGVSAFETNLGEQRSILLADGSMVELNTATRVEVSYSATERRVRLRAGEAVFDVRPDPERPLRVLAGPAEVLALGTRFNVYRQEDQTVVTVVQGRVSVTRVGPEAGRRATAGAAVQVGQGEQVTVRAAEPLTEPNAVDVLAVTAWRDRRLVFDGSRLDRVVREINRYNHRKLELVDADLAPRRISGVFAANRPDAMAVFLQTVGGMHLEETGRGWTIRSARATDDTGTAPRSPSNDTW